jgi:oligopeptide/dipeptide ABC transporter ATP-binding protein
MAAPLLDVRHLTVSHLQGSRRVRALREVSLQLFPGEALALVGESGSGKTTLAHAIARLLAPPSRVESGEVVLDGVDLLGLSERAMRDVRGRQIGMIFQHPRSALNPVLDARAHLVESLRAHQRVDRGTARERARSLMAEVGIPDPAAFERRYPFELSGGLCQRLAIALGICHTPRVLVADEPTSALDPTIAVQVLELLATLRRRYHLTLLLVTNDLAAARRFCDRVAVMYHGRIVEVGSASETLARPAHPYTRALVDCVLDLSDAGAGAPLRFIPGMHPAASEEPAGCSFAPRCPLAELQCTGSLPPPLPVSDSHWAACIKAGAC